MVSDEHGVAPLALLAAFAWMLDVAVDVHRGTPASTVAMVLYLALDANPDLQSCPVVSRARAGR